MPPADDIQTYLVGAWRMMTGRSDGLRMMDLSVDGFWNSFFAIVVAMPVMLASWVPIANDLAGSHASFALRLGFVLRLALADILAWVLPLAAFALVSGQVGLRDRFVPYVVATNWGGALLVWIMLPPALVRLFFPDGREAVTLISLLLFVVTLVLSWRLTNAAIAKGPGVATAVFAAMLAGGLAVLFALQGLLGIGGNL